MPNKYNERLFLRGHLKCKKCGGNLTGSGSKSKTGAKHYYYHCNPRKGCNERFKVADAHNELMELFKLMKPSVEVCELFELVLEDNYKISKQSQYNDLKRVELEIERLETKKIQLLDKLLDEVISNENYTKHNNVIEEELAEKQNELLILNDYQKDLKEYVSFGLKLIKNLEIFFENGDIHIKNKLMSSMLEEKMEFDGEKYRTPKFKEGFKFIYQKIKRLQSFGIEKGNTFSDISLNVLEAGLEPARPQWSLDFKSNVSTNSTTRARLKKERKTGFEPATLTLAR